MFFEYFKCVFGNVVVLEYEIVGISKDCLFDFVVIVSGWLMGNCLDLFFGEVNVVVGFIVLREYKLRVNGEICVDLFEFLEFRIDFVIFGVIEVEIVCGMCEGVRNNIEDCLLIFWCVGCGIGIFDGIVFVK